MFNLAALAGALLAPSFTAGPDRSAATRTIFHFHEPREYSVDGTRVAVLGPAATLAAEPGVAGVTASPVAGWTLVTLTADTLVHDAAAAWSRRGVVAFLSPVLVDDLGGAMFATPDVLVGFDRSLSHAECERALGDEAGAAPFERDWAGMPNTYRVRTAYSTGDAVIDLASRLARRGDVLFAEPDVAFTGKSALIPNDPGFSTCWGLHNTGQSGGVLDADMDAAEAWDQTLGVASIVTVVIDTGVEQSHPDINQVTGSDFTSDGTEGNGGPVNACDNHGTAVAGCVSARINNSLGTVGAAPNTRSASARCFISIPACNGGWNAQGSWTVNALAWAESIGARVTNNSNIYGFQSSAIEQKYFDTRNAGIVHFAAAGNNATNSISYPSSIPSVNAVAALNRAGVRAGFSNFGAGLDFSAPGEAIYSTDRTGGAGYFAGDYGSVSGTSFASPYTAGVAALVLSVRPSLDAAQVEAVLRESCVDIYAAGYDTNSGWGFVNADRAVRLAACRADFDGDGFVTGDDFDAFSVEFVAGNAAADFDGNGFVTGDDFDGYVEAFEAGC